MTNVENNQITDSKCKKLPGIKLDHKLNVSADVDLIFKKPGQRMNALYSIMPMYMNTTKRHALLNMFFISLLDHCPLTWICHRRAKNEKTNLYDTCVRIIYNDKVSTFEQLLEKDSSVSIYTRNLCFLAVEMFKVIKGIAPTITNNLFDLKETNNYNLRYKLFFKIPRNETARNVFKSISYLGPKILKLLPV